MEADDQISGLENIIFPNELNTFLKEKMAVLTHENGMLQKHLEERTERCNELEKELQKKTTVCNKETKETKLDISSPINQRLLKVSSVSEKLIELSKDLRSKTSELETFKTKYSKLRMYVEKLEQQLECPSNRVVNPQKIEQRTKNSTTEEQQEEKIKQLQEKLNSAINKLLEKKNVNAQLKNELKTAHKLLLEETGEELAALQGNSSWKGRAQIISDLKDKNCRLKEKICQLQGAQLIATNQNEKITSKISTLEKENSDLKEQNETLKRKLDSLKSRLNTIEMERRDIKSKLIGMDECKEKNFQLINILTRQLADVESAKKSALKLKDNELKKIEIDVKNLTAVVEQYKELLKKSNETTYAMANNETPEINIHHNNKESETKKNNKIQILEEEKSKLLKLLNLEKQRVNKERAENEKYQQTLRVEKQKIAKLELALNKSELESKTIKPPSYSEICTPSKQQQLLIENKLANQLEIAEEQIKCLRTKIDLEQYERQQDFQAFSEILLSSSSNNNTESNFDCE